MSKFFSVLGGPVLAGSLLIAPAAQATLSIGAGATKNVSCVSNVCTATDKNAVLNVGELAAMLAGHDVAVRAQGDAQTIGIAASLSWASSHVLSLTAQHDVVVRVPVAVEGLGGVIITAGGDGDGDLKFATGGKIDFWDTGASFTLNGTAYALTADAASIAAAYSHDNRANVALAKDYDAGPDGTYDGAAISAPMSGGFEGLGHTVSNFSAGGNGRTTGFFATTSGDFSTIRDLTLSNAHVANANQATEGHPAFAGVLVAGASANTKIVGVHASGTVQALDWSNVGGLSGAGGFFVRSDSSVAVSCANHCGAGGLAGEDGSFLLSHATGSVTVGGHSIGGGLIGRFSYPSLGTITQSYATGAVVSSARRNQPASLGGLVGEAVEHSFPKTTITDSYALSTVRKAGAGQLGGMVGFLPNIDVHNSYSAGAVKGTGEGAFGGAGGFIGFAQAADHADFSNDYWDLGRSGWGRACGGTFHGHCPPVTGLSDTTLKAQLPAGFDPAIWGQSPSINKSYPYLLNNPPE